MSLKLFTLLITNSGKSFEGPPSSTRLPLVPVAKKLLSVAEETDKALGRFENAGEVCQTQQVELWHKTQLPSYQTA
jgi:hypothetical protein